MKYLIYIGDHFYYESGSVMSSVYLEDGTRFDWGKLKVALSNGEEIHIRQATNEECGYYERKLRQLNKAPPKPEKGSECDGKHFAARGWTGRENKKGTVCLSVHVHDGRTQLSLRSVQDTVSRFGV
jgi:hypothetical protein